jgi:hypothetical protein
MSNVSPPSTSGQGREGRRSSGGGRNSGASDANREKQDPKHVGPWRIGKTIGKGSSGEFSFPIFLRDGLELAVQACPREREERGGREIGRVELWERVMPPPQWE